MALAKGSQVALLGTAIVGTVLGGSAGAGGWTVWANGVVINMLDADLAPDETVADAQPAGKPLVNDFVVVDENRWQVAAYVHRVGAAGVGLVVLTRYPLSEGNVPAFPYTVFLRTTALP